MCAWNFKYFILWCSSKPKIVSQNKTRNLLWLNPQKRINLIADTSVQLHMTH